MSDKRGWVLFGAKPAQSEAPPEPRLRGVHLNQGGVEKAPEGLLWGALRNEASADDGANAGPDFAAALLVADLERCPRVVAEKG